MGNKALLSPYLALFQPSEYTNDIIPHSNINNIQSPAKNQIPSSSKKFNGKSLWDRLPAETRNSIIEFCDPLTQFLHSYGLYALDAIQKLADTTKRQLQNDIWRSSLDIKWCGNFQSLPGVFTPDNEAEWYRLVNEKSLWKRVFKPIASRLWNRSTIITSMQSIAQNIVMRHAWVDMLGADLVVWAKNQYNRNMVIESGHYNLMRQIEMHTNLSQESWKKASLLFAKEGQVDALEYLLLRKAGGDNVISQMTLSLAAQHGHLDTFKLLYREKQMLNFSTHAIVKAACKAAAGGHLHIIQYLIRMKIHFSNVRILDSAAAGGHLKLVKYLHENRLARCSENAIDLAAANGHLHVVKYLHQAQCQCTTEAMDSAASEGHFGVVQFLHEYRDEGCTTNAIDSSATNGNLKIVRFLNDYRNEGFTRKALYGAAENGFNEVVVYLTTNGRCGFGWDELKEARNLAYANGHHRTAKYLESHLWGCVKETKESVEVF
ncbi:hypothetical protein HDV05_005571 [Chytridiales sp. JEL 0842]|nr:hypothetical protein HDV05_005571 [Chytridiales sp. JEL 0842]